MGILLKGTFLIIDFDSTFTQVEALDELGKIVLRGPEKDDHLKKIAEITNKGMSGEISFSESLRERMKILSGNQEDLDKLVEVLKTKVSESIKSNKEFFKQNAQNIHIVSSGFKAFIVPVVAEYGIDDTNVHANTFIWENNTISGFDSQNVLSKDKGKPSLVNSLNLPGKVVVIGDGYTDYEIKEAGSADLFVAFTENVSRPAVLDKADYIATNFNDFLNFITHDTNTFLPQA